MTAVQALQTAVSEDLRARWNQAIELWLASRRSASTRRSYAAALQDILSATTRAPWEITRADVIRWAGELRQRGLAENTIAQRLAGLSSFYRFTLDEFEGLAGSNPAASRAIRPHLSPYGKAVWLSPEESRALLSAIRAEAGNATGIRHARALRDYALFLGYLMTGRRNSEWRQARWGDFIQRGSGRMLRWSGKGKTDQLLALPGPVWTALRAYLAAAADLRAAQGLPAEPGANEYVFTWLRGSLAQRPPLCSREVGRLLKRYCRLAGLNSKAIHVHTLRHSAAMLRKEAGDGIEDISYFLSHSSVAITQIYVHSLEGRQDRSWGRVADLLGL